MTTALTKTEVQKGIGVDTVGIPLERLLEKEWLLTNTRGGYSSSSIIGCNTRRYHGLLIGSLWPPVNRIVALSHCLETVVLGPGKFDLGTCEFPDKITPDGYLRLKRFERDIGVQFVYQLGDLRLTKSVYLFRERDTVAIVYEFTEVAQAIEFLVRPFVALRDYHSLQKSDAKLVFKSSPEGLLFRNSNADCGRLLLSCPGGIFEDGPEWWYNFVYRIDRERGQDFMEDLFCPGIIRYRVESAGKVVLWADLSSEGEQEEFLPPDIEYVIRQLREHRESVIAPAKGDRRLGELFEAGDQFIVKRVNVERRTSNIERSTRNAERTTILAGYPWFADWGRDSFISLPGLLLATRRFEEAKSVLLTFAGAMKEGMIPNCFDDYTDTAHFNSVDASLWFINSAFAYLAASGDRRTFRSELFPAIITIIESYQKGTMFGIRADVDGLITAGDRDTQLTWMDAKYGGVVFTPRYGKAVEVNALWYNALMLLVQYLGDSENSEEQLLDVLRKRVGVVRESFCRLFWNGTWGWLNDCVTPDGTADSTSSPQADATLRPNQIYAAALPFSALEPARQKAVVEIVEKKLLTPYGLRTLSPDDRRYHGTYTGGQQQRDEAYHQGSVWPYLMGAFVEAYLKVNGFSRESKKQARRFIEPLLKHLSDDGCLGQVVEIFEGDPPHKPKGCFAQAWSVAELIRAYMLVRD